MSKCQHCNQEIALSSFTDLGFYEPDVDPGNDPVIWRHASTGYAACSSARWVNFASPTPEETP